MTFAEEARTCLIGLNSDYRDNNRFCVQIEDSELFSDRDSLKQMVNRWRGRFPFLEAWRLDSAEHSQGHSLLMLRNTRHSDIDEFSETYLEQGTGIFKAPEPSDQDEPFSLAEGFHPVGGFTGGIYPMSPVAGSYLSEFSFHYLALFLLSSLVRYRPHIWMHAISRSVMSDTPADDRALSLVERFLDINVSAIPEMVVTVLNPHEDFYS
jgi:hypothetical protein